MSSRDRVEGARTPLTKILVSAYACRPGLGSEHGVGWQATVAALETGAQVWLVTRAKNAGLVRSADTAIDQDRLHIVPIELGRVMRGIKQVPAGDQLYYSAWQRRARAVILDLHTAERFDVAHHATFATEWLPAAAVGIPGLPSVWGPVGGLLGTPRDLWRYLGARGVVGEVFRRVARGTFGARNARRASALATVTVVQNDDALVRYVRKGAIVRPNVAIDTLPDTTSLVRDGGIVGVGRLLPWKGWALAIRVVARYPDLGTLDIYGAGPDLRRLRRLVVRLGAEDRIALRGVLPRPQTLRAIAQARVVVSTSLHEAAGWAVAEALTLGTPVVALDLGGTGTLLRGAGLAPVDPAAVDLESRLADGLRMTTRRVHTSAWTSEAFRRDVQSWLATAVNAESVGRS